MKTHRFICLAGIMFLSLACCKNESNKDSNNNEFTEEDNIPCAEVTLSASTGVQVKAIGVELDPHFYSQNVIGKNDASKEEDWQIVIDRVKKMGVHRFRVMIQPQWYEPYNDNDDPFNTDFSKFHWNTIEMQSLYKVLDLAQEAGLDVCLVVWGCPRSAAMVEKDKYSDVTTCFMADLDGCTNWVCPPISNDEFGENFAALVKYLRDEKGYSCVNEITPFNEPDGNVCEINRYIELCKVLDSHFKELGLRDNVKFCLSDNTDTRRFYLEACAESLKGIADSFNSHTYIFGYETPNSTVQEWERLNVAASKKAGLTHMVGEFGSNQCVGATRQKDIDFYLRGVLMTRHVLNFFNAGATGVSYWSLIDQYYHYGDGLQNMQQLGLWRYLLKTYRSNEIFSKLTDDYQCRYQYYSYSMLTENIDRGADIYPIELGYDFANATAFKNPDSKWVYVIANQEDKTIGLSIKNDVAGEFEIIRYKEDELHADDSLLEPYRTKSTENGALNVVAYPNTVVLCRQV